MMTRLLLGATLVLLSAGEAAAQTRAGRWDVSLAVGYTRLSLLDVNDGAYNQQLASERIAGFSLPPWQEIHGTTVFAGRVFYRAERDVHYGLELDGWRLTGEIGSEKPGERFVQKRTLGGLEGRALLWLGRRLAGGPTGSVTVGAGLGRVTANILNVRDFSNARDAGTALEGSGEFSGVYLTGSVDLGLSVPLVGPLSAVVQAGYVYGNAGSISGRSRTDLTPEHDDESTSEVNLSGWRATGGLNYTF